MLSKNLNIRKPAATENMLKGILRNVTIIPAVSSITIEGGSFFFNIFSAPLAIHIANRINSAVQITATNRSIFDRKKAIGRPAIDPKVPGAKGIFPTKQTVARRITSLCLKFIARFYNPASYLSSCNAQHTAIPGKQYLSEN